MGVWQQFLAVRAGEISNPCPPEVGLRKARLWDAICLSAARGGRSNFTFKRFLTNECKLNVIRITIRMVNQRNP